MKFSFLHDGAPLELDISAMANAGYAGREQDSVRAHIEELRAIGVKAPESVPTFYPVPMLQLTSDGEIQVGHAQTSAEIEYVFIRSGGKEYITVGSDHSDRALEAYSVCAAKQICPNVIAGELWDYGSVKEHFDMLELLCEYEQDGVWHEYQRGSCGQLLPPEELLRLGRSVLPDGDFALYSGTIPTAGELAFSRRWRCTMCDPQSGKKISFEYIAQQMPDAIE